MLKLIHVSAVDEQSVMDLDCDPDSDQYLTAGGDVLNSLFTLMYSTCLHSGSQSMAIYSNRCPQFDPKHNNMVLCIALIDPGCWLITDVQAF